MEYNLQTKAEWGPPHSESYYLESNYTVEVPVEYSEKSRQSLGALDPCILLESVWDSMAANLKFPMKDVYNCLLNAGTVEWNNLIRFNPARPHAVFCLWMQCHGRLPTKERMCRFGFIGDAICSMCGRDNENLHHVYFDCHSSLAIWCSILNWIGIIHTPRPWTEEFHWILANTKKKGWKAKLLKLAFTETIYGIWQFRNSKVFGNNAYTEHTTTLSIIDCIMHRGWIDRKLRNHIASFLL
ncbi:uncharacterized protein LOC131623085 [Vicia villosa]|uniref:uncharacterized protein LOC131623085 n=1 Tax=Vicia villosa TaxID=3911 RepID=UPI00273C59BC|nr:uncharacterized protein LOC131623085 [Vicia villosa]